MAHEDHNFETELAEVLAFLDDALQHTDSSLTDAVQSESNGGDQELTSAVGNDIGDFRQHLTINQAAYPPMSQTMDQAREKTTRRKKKQGNPNKARDERRFELLQLRQEVEDLELTLQQWQTIRSKWMQRDTEKKDDSIHETTDDADEVPAVWKDICARQRDRRLEAERENIRLKTQCKEEMQVVKSIQKVLFKRLGHVSQTEANKRTRRTNLPAGYIKHIAALLFEELSIGSETCLRLGVAMLVAVNPITTNTLPHMPLLRGGIRGTERTLFDRISLPFGLHATGGAWWRNWQQYRGHVEEAADTVFESYGLEMNDFTALASVISYVQQVLRRNVEESRITLVWNAYIEPFVFKSEQVNGIYFLEQCHIVMQPEDVESGADEYLNATCMSSCYVVTPYFLDPALENDPNALSLIDFLIGSLFSNMKAFNERVEDLLLDEALQKHNLR